jgi:uncharacterized membrane protein
MGFMDLIKKYSMVIFAVLGVILLICCICAIVVSPYLWIFVVMICILIGVGLFYYFKFKKVGSLIKHGSGYGYDSTDSIFTESSL